MGLFIFLLCLQFEKLTASSVRIILCVLYSLFGSYFQRQRIRELLLKQQQQRIAIRQERGPHDPTGNNMPPGAPRPWPQEGEMFNRPPPPYPGQGPMRGQMRYPGPFPGEHRGSFPNEGQIPRGMHPGDPNMRHHGPRLVLGFCDIALGLAFILL